MKSQSKFDLMKWLHVFVWIYFTLIFAWALAHFLLGDHPWWMFALNALSFYGFVPWLAVLPLAWRARRRATWMGTLLVFLLAAFLYGKVYIPWRVGNVPAGQSLTVMIYNVLGYNWHTQEVTDAILASGADVVALQELNPQVAKAIRENLSAVYPYQQLDGRDDVFGSGVISRYPLHLTDEKLPGGWVGTPQILTLTVNGKSITLLNAHTFASHPDKPEIMEAAIAERERQARDIRDFASRHPEPLIVTTDLNSTPQNTTHQIITSILADSWLEAGWGPGNTFPNIPGRGARPGMPLWLIRIDYIFHSPQLRAVDAQIGPWDGYSDHRPVIARLVLMGS